MRYVYVVTVITEGLPDGVRSIPTLGVHTNYPKAVRHLRSIKKDREQYLARMWFVPPLDDDGRVSVPMQLEVEYTASPKRESIRIERWKVQS